jgi:hypothetical protein
LKKFLFYFQTDHSGNITGKIKFSEETIQNLMRKL